MMLAYCSLVKLLFPKVGGVDVSKVMVTKPEQFMNAHFPMLVTLLGMMMEAKLVHPSNATSPMLVTLLGITVELQPRINVFVAVSIMALQLFLESYTVFPFSITMLKREKQPTNASSPMLVMLLGMVMDAKPLQPLNAKFPMFVTLFGMVMVVKLEQFMNAHPPMFVTLFGMGIEVKPL